MHRLREETPETLVTGRWRWVAIAAAVVVADQAVKQLIVNNLAVGEQIDFGWVSINHIRNSGAAFGLFRGATWFLVGAALAGVAMFGFMLRHNLKTASAVAISLVAGGAVGNVLDRMLRPAWFRGTVVDYIDFGWWPAFNVADICVSTGVILLLWKGLESADEDSS